jgi:hypothetical protein
MALDSGDFLPRYHVEGWSTMRLISSLFTRGYFPDPWLFFWPMVIARGSSFAS